MQVLVGWPESGAEGPTGLHQEGANILSRCKVPELQSAGWKPLAGPVLRA